MATLKKLVVYTVVFFSLAFVYAMYTNAKETNDFAERTKHSLIKIVDSSALKHYLQELKKPSASNALEASKLASTKQITIQLNTFLKENKETLLKEINDLETAHDIYEFQDQIEAIMSVNDLLFYGNQIFYGVDDVKYLIKNFDEFKVTEGLGYAIYPNEWIASLEKNILQIFVETITNPILVFVWLVLTVAFLFFKLLIKLINKKSKELKEKKDAAETKQGQGFFKKLLPTKALFWIVKKLSKIKKGKEEKKEEILLLEHDGTIYVPNQEENNEVAEVKEKPRDKTAPATIKPKA